MKTMWSPAYHHSGFVATHALRHMMYSLSCAQVHDLPQSHLAFVRFEHSVCRGSLMTTYILYIHIIHILYIYIYIYICIYR